MTFSIPDAAFTQHAIALGKTRSGKSSKLRLVVERLLDEQKPVCIVDPKGDWWGLKSSADGKKAGYPVIIFGGKHADVPVNEHSGAHVAELVATGNRPCIIDLGGWRVGARTRFFIDFAEAFFIHTRGTRWLAIDECHNFVPKGKVFSPDVGEMLHWGNRLASEGQGKGIILLSASQRPQKVHNDYLTSHETLIACRVVHKADRDAIKDWIDGCGDPVVGKEMIGALAAMKRTEAWVWSPEIGFGPERITFPMFSTYDSFKPQAGDGPVALKGWAAVDLEDVKTKLATVVEEAKANDPAALKAEIGKLKAEIGKLSRQPVAYKAGEKTITADLAAAREEGADAVRQSIPAMLDAQHAVSFEAGFQFLAARRAVYEAALLPERKPIPAVQSLIRAKVPPAPHPIAPITTRAAPSPPVTRGAAKAPGDITRAGNDLPGNQQRLLDSLLTWQAMGHPMPSNAQVAWLARYSPTSTSYTNPRGALKTAELIEYPAPDHVRLTPAGAKLAGQIDLGSSLIDFVLNQLPGNEARVLKAVARYHPSQASNDQVAEDAGYSATSTSYTNPRGALKTKDLITYPAPGMVRAADWLFT
jgi:uncharacterized protein